MIDSIHTDKLYRLWLQQIQLEFDDICYMHSVFLERPLFEISATRNELGGWCGDTRVLRISYHLICNYPWAVTQQVLKHEMAHQLCSESPELVGVSLAGHGDSFQQACEILGVLPEYRGHKVILSEFVDSLSRDAKLSSGSQKFLARVEKLLALGKSSNEHEAELAIQKANELIEKYHLSQLLLNERPEYTFLVINRKRKQVATYQKSICSILQEFFFVQVVLSSIYDPQENDTYKTIEVFGAVENVAIAEYCYYFLENQLSLLWTANKGQFGAKQRSHKNSYLLGMVRGFYQKLQVQQELRQEEVDRTRHRALIVTEKGRLQQFVAMRFPKLSRRSSRKKKVYSETYQKGVEAGRQINFTDGITKEQTSGTPMITGSR